MNYTNPVSLTSLGIFLSLGFILGAAFLCVCVYVLYIQYSMKHTGYLDKVTVNEIDVQNHFCTADDQTA